MISEQKERVLLDILNWEDASEAVSILTKKYAKQSIDHARELLMLIPEVVDIGMENIWKVASANAQAARWLIFQRKIEPDSSSTFFASMVPVCKAVFPNGKPKNGSPDEIDYWNLFVELLQNPKVFSWEKDRVWADLNEYTEYLELVEAQLKKGEY